MELRDMQGLGLKSEQALRRIGICTPEQLRAVGPIRAYLRLCAEGSGKPSLNFLYAMVGAVEGRHWADIARHEKGRLLMALDGYQELEAIFREDGIQLHY